LGKSYFAIIQWILAFIGNDRRLHEIVIPARAGIQPLLETGRGGSGCRHCGNSGRGRKEQMMFFMKKKTLMGLSRTCG